MSPSSGAVPTNIAMLSDTCPQGGQGEGGTRYFVMTCPHLIEHARRGDGGADPDPPPSRADLAGGRSHHPPKPVRPGWVNGHKWSGVPRLSGWIGWRAAQAGTDG